MQMQMPALKRDRSQQNQNSAQRASTTRFQNTTHEILRQMQERLDLQKLIKLEEDLLASKRKLETLLVENNQDKMMQEEVLKTRQNVIRQEEELLEVQAQQRKKEALQKQKRLKEEHEKQMNLKIEQDKQIKIQEAQVKQAKFREEQEKLMKLKAEQQKKMKEEKEKLQMQDSKLNNPDLVLGPRMNLKQEKERLLRLKEEREKQWKRNLEIERQKKLAEMAEKKKFSFYSDLKTDHDEDESKDQRKNPPDVKMMKEKLLKQSYEQQSTLRVSSHLKSILQNPGIIERDERTGPELFMDKNGDQNRKAVKPFQPKKTDKEDEKEGPSQSIRQKVKVEIDPGPRKQAETNRELIKVKQSTFKVQLRTTQLCHGQTLKTPSDLHDVIQPKASSTSPSFHKRDQDNPAETVFAYQYQRQMYQSTPKMPSSSAENDSRKPVHESKLEKAARTRREEQDRKQEKLDEASRIRQVKLDRKLTRRRRRKVDGVWSFLFLCCCCPCNSMCA